MPANLNPPILHRKGTFQPRVKPEIGIRAARTGAGGFGPGGNLRVDPFPLPPGAAFRN